MKTTHILNHRSGTLEVVLDEESGEYTLHFYSPPTTGNTDEDFLRALLRCDPDFLCDLRRWILAIADGCQKRNGSVALNVDFLTSTGGQISESLKNAIAEAVGFDQFTISCWRTQSLRQKIAAIADPQREAHEVVRARVDVLREVMELLELFDTWGGDLRELIEVLKQLADAEWQRGSTKE
jgi:hypothetical protein